MPRKGEINLARVKREWPHHVAILADKVMGKGYDEVHGFANTLSVGPRGHGFRRTKHVNAVQDNGERRSHFL